MGNLLKFIGQSKLFNIINQKNQFKTVPAVVEEAREASGGESPVVLRDSKAASLPPLRPEQHHLSRFQHYLHQNPASLAGTPLLERVATLDPIVGAASAVRAGQVKPTRTTGACCCVFTEPGEGQDLN